MTAARRSIGRQFILITPGTKTDIRIAPDVRVKELAEPERGQTALTFQSWSTCLILMSFYFDRLPQTLLFNTNTHFYYSPTWTMYLFAIYYHIIRCRQCNGSWYSWWLSWTAICSPVQAVTQITQPISLSKQTSLISTDSACSYSPSRVVYNLPISEAVPRTMVLTVRSPTNMPIPMLSRDPGGTIMPSAAPWAQLSLASTPTNPFLPSPSRHFPPSYLLSNLAGKAHLQSYLPQ